MHALESSFVLNAKANKTFNICPNNADNIYLDESYY